MSYLYKNEEVLMYLRKSQADNPQETVEDTLRKHENMLQDLAVRMTGDKIPAHHIFREVVSGETIKDRTSMQQVLKLMESNEVRAVMVVDPQRLTRGDLVDCGTVINAFRYTDTMILTPARSFDLTEKYDRKFFEMELQHGADYLEYCKEILNRGRVASVMRGNYLGTVAPYGYKKVAYKEGNEKIHTLEILEEEAEGVRTAFTLYGKEGYSFVEVARRMNELGYKPRQSDMWRAVSIRGMVQNVVYTGMLHWNARKEVRHIEDGVVKVSRPRNHDCIIVPGRHPAIVTQELYDACKNRYKKNVPVRKSLAIRNPLAGIIQCRCGYSMSYRTNDKSAPRLLCDNQVHCHTASCTYEEMYNLVINILTSNIEDFSIKLKKENSGVARQKNHAAHLQKKLVQLQEKEVALWEKYTEEEMPQNVFDVLLRKNKDEITAVQNAIHRCQKEENVVIDYQDRLVKFSNALHALEDPNVSPQESNKLLKECIQKIVYSREPGTGEKRTGTEPNKKHARWNPNKMQVDVYLVQ